jgi:hypothetical protein
MLRSLRPLLFVALTLGACGDKRDDASATKPTGAAPPPTAAKPAAKPPTDDPFTPRDVSGATLAKVEDTVPGVAFAIELPTGLVREAKDAYVNWTWPDGTFNAPSITVMAIELPPADLAAAVASAKRTSDPELVVATQREVDGGFLVSVHTPDDRYLSTKLHRTVGGKALECSVVHRTSSKQGPIPARAATTALAEKICTSLTGR